jgi:hypothetical protein
LLAAQDKMIETLTQLNEKLTSKVKSLEASLVETKKTLTTTQDELAKKAEAEKRESEEKAVPMQVEKVAEAPVATATVPGSKEMEEEVKKWKSEAKRMRARVEEKETESKSGGDVTPCREESILIGRSVIFLLSQHAQEGSRGGSQDCPGDLGASRTTSRCCCLDRVGGRTDFGKGSRSRSRTERTGHQALRGFDKLDDPSSEDCQGRQWG